MAEKGLFFNAFHDEDYSTGYDRNYNGDDLSDWFSIVCDTGVLKAGLAVTAGTGLAVSVAIGKATIKGKGYISNTARTLTLETAPTGANNRYDMIVLRMDNTQVKSARRTYLTAITGTSSVPTVADLTRTADVYDLLLAVVTVAPNATQIQQTDIADKRGDPTLCPWFTAVKGYDDYYDAIVQDYESDVTFASAGASIATDLPTSLYNIKYSLIAVYTNGIREQDTAYTVGTSGSYITITFTANKAAGTKITVILSNYIDGEGMSTALAGYTAFTQAVADLQEATEHTYICNGLTDNAEITSIVNTFLAGGADKNSMRLKIAGTFGCLNGGTQPVTVGGSGTGVSPYLYFDFQAGQGTRRVVLDFTDCTEVALSITGSAVYSVMKIATSNVEIVGLNLTATVSAGSLTLIDNQGAAPTFRNCRFEGNAFTGATLAYNGFFENCKGVVKTTTQYGYCFAVASFLKVDGGEYRAYSGTSSAVVVMSNASAIAILYGVNCSAVAVSGLYQTYAIQQGNGYLRATDTITELPVYASTGVVRDTIVLNKPNVL